MTIADKNIIDAYSKLFEGLDSFMKLELIERLSKLIKNERGSKEEAFFRSFGAFPDDRLAEEIINDIKSSRSFRKKDVKF